MAAAAPDVEAIAATELSHVFDARLGRGPVALAVSGGADSMALMHLVASWRQSHSETTDVIVLTVDHGLRTEGASEAAFVADHAARLGFSHQTLLWAGVKPHSGVQAAARAARYGLMTDACRGLTPVPTLITAHHADDQLETVLMRLARGSGVEGLAAMRPETQVNGVRLVRPLLGFSKARLVATLQRDGVPWCEDISNANLKFERVRWRQTIAALKQCGLSVDALALSAGRLARASSALDAATDALERAARTNHHNGAYAELDLDVYAAAHVELQIRLLDRLITAHRGLSPAPQLSEMEDLAARMTGPSDGAATLGGTLVRWSQSRNRVVVTREPARASEAAVALHPGDVKLWDGRFEVSLRLSERSNTLCQTGPLAVRALGAADYATLRKGQKSTLPSEIAAALPAFYAEEKLIAVPYFSDHLGVRPQSEPMLGHGLCSVIWHRRGV